MKKQIATLLAGCIGLGLIAVIACKYAYYMIIVSSGPYSDAQIVAKSVEPIENVRVSATGRLCVIWEVDDRFLLECGDDFVIRRGTNVAELSEKWGAERVIKNDIAGTDRITYFVSDNANAAWPTFLCLEVNQAGEVVVVSAYCGCKKAVKILDLQSSREIGLYDTDYDTLVKFFRSLPK